MCLAIPMKVVNVLDDFCTVELNGVSKTCFIGFLEDKIDIGDFLLVHSGMAIKKLNLEESEAILKEISLLIEGESSES
ncbi:MAG: HypC/HybG/HupF family hydrogenase formation chaperone [Proteobacteria bacterium]|nr:HypC/HybG/HupF family hydrogenase formation chaperone [Pseudomonadota bacterium]